jgi:hypothetical protein
MGIKVQNVIKELAYWIMSCKLVLTLLFIWILEFSSN